jgi:dUTPase
MEKLKIYNGFGITPSKNYTAAGYDFHIPYITDESKFDFVLEAFKKSFKKTDEDIEETINLIGLYIESKYDNHEFSKCDFLNILHLFLALTPPDDVYPGEEAELQSLSDAIDEFVTYRLIFDDKFVPGIVVYSGDYLLFNSGIKVCLPVNTAGIFFNKSGKGNQGFDTRACVVDEDYSGFVHLSQAFDKDLYEGVNLYCGDKLAQMVVLPIVKTEIEEVEDTTYNDLMSNSQRGSDGFGSSDVKH